MPKMNGVPDRWEQYSAVGSQILGTRLIAFKTPLKDTICAKLELKNRFSVEMLVKKIPDLGLIIDLTNTTRYYNSDEVLRLGVAYAKVACPGQRIPPDNVVHRFFSVIDTFLDKHPNDGKLVGVHCTHGVNRTGYLLSRYLIQRMGFKAKEAVECITSARGHLIERGPYIEDLHDHVKPVSKNTRSMEIVEPGNPAVHGGVRSGQGNDGGLADLSRQQQNNNWRNSSGRPNKKCPGKQTPKERKRFFGNQGKVGTEKLSWRRRDTHPAPKGEESNDAPVARQRYHSASMSEDQRPTSSEPIPRSVEPGQSSSAPRPPPPLPQRQRLSPRTDEAQAHLDKIRCHFRTMSFAFPQGTAVSREVPLKRSPPM